MVVVGFVVRVIFVAIVLGLVVILAVIVGPRNLFFKSGQNWVSYCEMLLLSLLLSFISFVLVFIDFVGVVVIVVNQETFLKNVVQIRSVIA